MRRVLFAAMLFATPALAQPQTLSPDQTWNALFHQEAEGRAQATLQVTALQGKVAALQVELDATKKELDKLKPPAKTP